MLSAIMLHQILGIIQRISVFLFKVARAKTCVCRSTISQGVVSITTLCCLYLSAIWYLRGGLVAAWDQRHDGAGHNRELSANGFPCWQ